MTIRRLSTDALLLVLVCLVLGTVALAQTTVRAYTASGLRPDTPVCSGEATCAAHLTPVSLPARAAPV